MGFILCSSSFTKKKKLPSQVSVLRKVVGGLRGQKDFENFLKEFEDKMKLKKKNKMISFHKEKRKRKNEI